MKQRGVLAAWMVALALGAVVVGVGLIWLGFSIAGTQLLVTAAFVLVFALVVIVTRGTAIEAKSLELTHPTQWTMAQRTRSAILAVAFVFAVALSQVTGKFFVTGGVLGLVVAVLSVIQLCEGEVKRREGHSGESR